MDRYAALGNQSLLVNIDKWLQVRDIYFPYVGQYNHVLGNAHRIGIFVDNKISYINEPEWERNISYIDDTLITRSSAVNNKIGIKGEMNEQVYF